MPSFGRTIGTLYREAEVGTPEFLGSSFAFRRDGAFLTAAHCVQGVEAGQIRLASPGLNGGRLAPALSVVAHPIADLAVVKVRGVQAHLVDPFYMISLRHPPGSAVGAWGSPQDATAEGLLPTPRVFSGIVQREFRYRSHMDFEYDAGELSFGAPRGLSGGPVFTGPDNMHLVGVVTENHESSTELHAVEEVTGDGNTTTERIRRVIQYGLYVDLRPFGRWLDQEAGRELG